MLTANPQAPSLKKMLTRACFSGNLCNTQVTKYKKRRCRACGHIFPSTLVLRTVLRRAERSGCYSERLGMNAFFLSALRVFSVLAPGDLCFGISYTQRSKLCSNRFGDTYCCGSDGQI